MADLEWEKQYGIYFTGMSTLGGNIKNSPLYGNQQFKDIFFNFGCLGRALALSATKEYLVAAFEKRNDHDLLVLGVEMAKQFTVQFSVIAGAATVGAVIGSLAGTVTIPLAGTVAGAGSGAALGAGMASWLLFGIGLAELAGQGPYLLTAGRESIDRGVDLAMKGQAERAATEFAEFWAHMVAVILPIIIMAAFAKGCRGIGGRLVRSPAMVSHLQRFLVDPGSYTAASRVLGLTEQEISAFAQMSRGKIMVVRGCNPARLRYAHMGYHAKPLYLKEPWNSAQSGRYVGQIVAEEARLAKAMAEYELKPVQGIPGRFKLVPKKNYDAALEGHFVERFTENGKPMYRVLHRDGQPFVSDIDRVLSAKLDTNGHWMIGTGRANDHPAEIAWINELMRNRANNSQVSYNVFQHGHAWENLQRQPGSGIQMPGWPSRTGSRWNFSAEPLLVAVNGHNYIMNWPQFQAFCKAFEYAGAFFPWK